ncbi:MAG: winged helix-turn-helix transcriptional regulator [Thermodesulfobacteriota bacterium]
MSTAYETFTAEDKAVLRIVQGTLPDSATPFADIAQEVGVSESAVLDLLRRLQANGGIRRFGATLRHQQAGYGHNAMVAWYVEQDHDLHEVGARMAERPEITHCYQRRNCLDWPYNMYTMIHGKSLEDCLRVIGELQAATGVQQYEILFSDQELKKTSMRYF